MTLYYYLSLYYLFAGDGRERMSAVSANSNASTRPLSTARSISYEPVTTSGPERPNGEVGTNPRNSRIKSKYSRSFRIKKY